MKLRSLHVRQYSVSEGIPEDMDITEHNPEVETSDEDGDRSSEASEESHGERADNTQIQDVAGSAPGQVNLPSPAARNRSRRETRTSARYGDFAQAKQVLTPTLARSVFKQGFCEILSKLVQLIWAPCCCVL